MVCYICGKKLLSTDVSNEDHVPQAGFFLADNPPGIIKLNTHKKCNEGFSRDEQYVINIIRGTGNWNPTAERIWKQRGLMSITDPNRIGLLTKIIDETKLIDGMYVTQPDQTRILNVVHKIAEGLYFHEFERTLESDKFEIKDWFTKQGRYSFDGPGFKVIGNTGKEEFRYLKKVSKDAIEYNLFFYNIHHFWLLYERKESVTKI